MGILTFLFGKSTTPNPGGGSTKIVSRGNIDTGRVSHDRFVFLDKSGGHSHESYTYNRDSGKTREYSRPDPNAKAWEP